MCLALIYGGKIAVDRERSRGERELPWQGRKRKLQESANPLEAPERGSKVVKKAERNIGLSRRREERREEQECGWDDERGQIQNTYTPYESIPY